MTTTRGSGTVESEGEVLAYDVASPASWDTTAVLVHGAGGNRATWWSTVPLLVEGGLRVVTVDLRGAGRSTDRADEAGPRSGARDLDALRRHLELGAWHVVGHSAGGWPALRHAVEQPGAVLSVTLVGSVAGVFPPAVDAWWQQLLAGFAATPWPGHVELGRTPSLSDGFCAAEPALAYLYQLVAALNPPPSPTGPGRDIRSADVTPAELARLTMPVRFVSGALDAAIAPHAVRAAASAVAGASYDELPDVGHLPFWEQPKSFSRWLLDALNRPWP